MRLGIAREQQAAAGVAIQPVDGQRQPLESETEMVKIVFQAFRSARPRMHRKTGRLVDHDRLGVDEKYVFLPHFSALPRLWPGRNESHRIGLKSHLRGINLLTSFIGWLIKITGFRRPDGQEP
jgi:hypothetical protein